MVLTERNLRGSEPGMWPETNEKNLKMELIIYTLIKIVKILVYKPYQFNLPTRYFWF